ncbi:2-succinylbenzoate--CoA ligase, chloroplastic/peroxisomal-like isoform X2 [Zingiber officinale]|uniref:4-coumarate--CoA ligase n=1 Tax=Zingiber officinale TaxID=94328 RepID=A0A8J5LKJ1_ZINOF|nr:2-succinylbenzoate--CoA ligase, chloroplastic/peroxisomal-like isoform X2 [Zingiber officinale]KAG6516048.1 hypothetical protein ZIOFF_026495 [Zingiber officinale]
MDTYSRSHVCLCLRRLEAIRGHAPVTIAGARRKTGSKFVEGVHSLSRALADSGIARGDVVAIAALNSDWYVQLFLAITYIGAIVAPLNHRWSFEEARVAMKLVNPKMLVVDEHCNRWALQLQEEEKNLPSINLYLHIGESPSTFSCNHNYLTIEMVRRFVEASPMPDPIFAPGDIALICFTSGTTGKPKGVAISHTAIIVQSLAKISNIGYGEDDVYLHTAPLCHIGGISSCLAMLWAGGCHILIPKFDARLTFEAIKEFKVTSFITVPAMMADLVAYERKFNLSSNGETVSKVLNGGGGLPQELVRGANRIFPLAKIFSAYGMTEACSSLTFMTLCDPTDKRNGISFHEETTNGTLVRQLGGVCVGKPASHVQIKISSSNGSTCDPFVGNIMTRGLHVMAGYWNHRELITLDFDEKGWLETGDIGWIDCHGNLWLIGRKKACIKSGGENVYPEEVEAVISEHPGISKVVVVGVPDIRLNEKLVACLNIKEGWKWVDRNSKYAAEEKQVSDEIIQYHCRHKNLTRFKIPKIYMLWGKPFPLTTTGKLRRDEVRKDLLSLVQLPSNL